MASITMTASFPGGSAATTMSKLPSTTGHRSLVVAKAMRVSKSGDRSEQETGSKRRDLVFAAAACSLGKIAVAEEEPKRGTVDAKKKYAAICVSMPTANICRK